MREAERKHRPSPPTLRLTLPARFGQAYEMVLLHGGPRRVFALTDAEVIVRDLALLQDFFCAQDAQGVPQGVPWRVVSGT